jgi:hypothetical protein
MLAVLRSAGKPIIDPANNVTTPRLRLLTALVAVRDTGVNFDYSGFLLGGRVISNGVGVRRTTPGSGEIAIGGITRADKVDKAFLYWMTTGAPDPNVTFQTMPVTGQLVGSSRSPCSTANFGGATRVYRADVTSLFTSNGTYQVGDVGTATGPGEGASLVVVLEQPTSTQKVVVEINDGAATAKPGETMNTVWSGLVSNNPFTAGTLNVGIGNGGPKSDGPMVLDGVWLSPINTFNGHDGLRWDDYRYDLKGPFPFPADAWVTQGDDCLAWAYAALTFIL